MQPSTFSVFYFYTDSDRRRQALEQERGSAERYCLFGLDQLAERGVRVRHNLEGRGPSPAALRAERAVNRLLYRAGGFGGEFGTVLSHAGEARRTDVVFATVDSVATPVMLAKRAGLVRRPVVYGSVGLLDRLVRLRGDRMTRLFAATLSRAATIITYSEAEAGLLRGWFELHGHRPRVVFVPFGVDTDYFRPQPDGKHDLDVVSIGADSHRDFPLVLRLAAKHPDLRLRIVASGHSAPDAAQVTPNVELEVDVPFGLVRERLAAARVVALPVRQNSYSGATTVLLQAMAMGKPVVVSRTHAIASGYGLSDGDNCRLVEPGDEGSFDAAVVDLLEDGSARAALGARARETVETALSWGRYADSLHGVLLEAAGRSR